MFHVNKNTRIIKILLAMFYLQIVCELFNQTSRLRLCLMVLMTSFDPVTLHVNI